MGRQGSHDWQMVRTAFDLKDSFSCINIQALYLIVAETTDEGCSVYCKEKVADFIFHQVFLFADR